MMDDIELAAEHWDDYTRKYAGKSTGLYWYELPGVLNYINRRISGQPDVDWVEYTVKKYFRRDSPLDACVSLGCGTGKLERDLAQLKAFRNCDAYDVSEESVKTARELAAEQGNESICYHVADVNQLELPTASYDAAWFYGSLHHFHALEHVLLQVKKSLKSEGLLVFNEYVGPSRFQFPDRQKEVANLCLKLLPLRYRKIGEMALELEAGKARRKVVIQEAGTDTIWTRLMRKWFGRPRKPETGGIPVDIETLNTAYREEVGFPDIEDVIDDDPSESVRSADILRLVRQHFEIVEETLWGGNIPQFLLSGIAGNFEDDDPCAQALLEMIWKIDRTMIECGELQSDCAYVVARPLR